MGSLHGQEVACLYVHKSGLKPHLFLKLTSFSSPAVIIIFFLYQYSLLSKPRIVCAMVNWILYKKWIILYIVVLYLLVSSIKVFKSNSYTRASIALCGFQNPHCRYYYKGNKWFWNTTRTTAGDFFFVLFLILLLGGLYHFEINSHSMTVIPFCAKHIYYLINSYIMSNFMLRSQDPLYRIKLMPDLVNSRKSCVLFQVQPYI